MMNSPELGLGRCLKTKTGAKNFTGRRNLRTVRKVKQSDPSPPFHIKVISIRILFATVIRAGPHSRHSFTALPFIYNPLCALMVWKKGCRRRRGYGEPLDSLNETYSSRLLCVFCVMAPCTIHQAERKAEEILQEQNARFVRGAVGVSSDEHVQHFSFNLISCRTTFLFMCLWVLSFFYSTAFVCAERRRIFHHNPKASARNHTWSICVVSNLTLLQQPDPFLDARSRRNMATNCLFNEICLVIESFRFLHFYFMHTQEDFSPVLPDAALHIRLVSFAFFLPSSVSSFLMSREK